MTIREADDLEGIVITSPLTGRGKAETTNYKVWYCTACGGFFIYPADIRRGQPMASLPRKCPYCKETG